MPRMSRGVLEGDCSGLDPMWRCPVSCHPKDAVDVGMSHARGIAHRDGESRMMRLLVCVDTGHLSRTIIPQAAALAAACDAEVHLLHVVDPKSARATGRHIHGWDIRASMDPSGGGIEVAPGVGSAQRRDAVYDRQVIEGGPAALQRVEDQTADALDVLAIGFPAGVTRVVLADSDAARAIVTYATDQAIDIIVMATHSRHGVTRVLRGSTTNAVIGAKVAPVLVVPPDEA